MLRFVGVEVSDAKVIQGVWDHNTGYYLRSYITPIRFEMFARQAKRGVDAKRFWKGSFRKSLLVKVLDILAVKTLSFLRYVIGSRLRDEYPNVRTVSMSRAYSTSWR